MFGFLLTRPLRDVTRGCILLSPEWEFLLTRPLRDVTNFKIGGNTYNVISTHTPLAGRDG